jgi:hypothetical protein
MAGTSPAMTKLPFDFLPPMPPRLAGAGARYLSEFPMGRFVERLQRDLAGPVLLLKINPFRRRANHSYKSARLVPHRGVSRSSRTRDGMRWTRQCRARNWNRRAALTGVVSEQPARRRTALMRTAKPCGPGTRCWCQVGGGASARPGLDNPYPLMTVTRRIRRRGEHGISR